MIRDITITSKGDYSSIRFSREADSNYIDMGFNYPNGCSYASFKLEDMEKAIEILSGKPTMTINMNGNEYQFLASRTINSDLSHTEMVSHSLHGMVGEIGEIHSLYQKVYQGHYIDDEHLKKECGDLLWFIAEFCTGNGWDIEDIMRMNIDKLKARFPEGFSADKSLNRKEGDI